MKKILYIEDEIDHITLLKSLLESNGFIFIAAMDAEAGLKSLTEHKPDLVLLDLDLPKFNGVEVLKKIKANSKTKNIPVFVVSAYGDLDNAQICRKYGAEEFIRKPFDTNELLKKIERLLKK